MIQVLHIITSPCGGGAEVLVRELARRGNVEGLQSKALYFNTNAPCAKNLELSSNEYSLDVGFRSLKAIFLLRKFIKNELKENPNLIVHAHLTWPFFFLALVSIGLCVRLIYTEHNTFNKRRKIPFFKYVERLFYGRYSRIICISQGVYESLSKWVGPKLSKRLVVINNGARIYSFHNRNHSLNKINFVSVGSLTDKKNFETTIKALAHLDSIDWRYTIIGEGSERSNLEKLIVELNLQDRVKLIGWSNEIEDYLHNADIQLIPSLWEGFGLVAVEGMSTGLPVVASNVEGLNEVLSGAKNAAYLVDNPEDAQEWLNRIENCIQSINTDIDHVSNSARKNAVIFSLEMMVERYKSLYASQI